MKTHIFELAVRSAMSRRRLLQGAASLGALASIGLPRGAMAQEDSAALRAQLLKIPGVGMGSPTDQHWQQVGELCLGATKASVAEGEFAGVELTFMGLNNQNLHNFLFRGFLKPWETYTGAKINWIDLAQADYNARLQQAVATGTVDFDILEMGAPFEGDTAGRGLLDEMPEWVAQQIDMTDYVDYLKAPVGTWDDKTYRVSIDGDCHTFSYRKDYLTDPAITAATGMTEPPTTWKQINDFSKKVVGQTDPLTGLEAYGFLDPLKGWGGFGFYFLEDRATAYVKHPDDPAWLFDPDTMKSRVNNPGWVQAIQDVMDLVAANAYPKDQINADPGTTAFQQFLAGTGSMLTWWGDVGSSARTSDTSVVGDVVGFSITPAQSASTSQGRRLGDAGRRELRPEHGLYWLGRLRHQPSVGRRQEAQGSLVGGGPSRRQGPLALDRCLSLGLPTLPHLALPVRRVGSGGVRPRLRRGLPRVEPRQLQPSQRRHRATHPRHFPVLLGCRGRTGEGLRWSVR